MTERRQTVFLRSLISLFKVCWPSAERGRKYGTSLEPLINGTPFFIEADAEAQWPDIQNVIESSEKKYKNDERPRLVIFKQLRKEPLAVMRVTDFVDFLNKHLWRPTDEQ